MTKDIQALADAADLIVDGYAFVRVDDFVRVVDLDRPRSVAVIDARDRIVETTMDDIENAIVLGIYKSDSGFYTGQTN